MKAAPREMCTWHRLADLVFLFQSIPAKSSRSRVHKCRTISSEGPQRRECTGLTFDEPKHGDYGTNRLMNQTSATMRTNWVRIMAAAPDKPVMVETLK